RRLHNPARREAVENKRRHPDASELLGPAVDIAGHSTGAVDQDYSRETVRAGPWEAQLPGNHHRLAVLRPGQELLVRQRYCVEGMHLNTCRLRVAERWSKPEDADERDHPEHDLRQGRDDVHNRCPPHNTMTVRLSDH